MTASPPPQTILVTGADSNYFSLMSDAINSFRSFPESQQLALGVLDYGLTEQERLWVEGQGGLLVRPDQLMPLPDGTDERKAVTYTSRLYLPEYFPGYRRYIWLDADAWLQTWDAIDELVSGADASGFAAVHESDPGYRFDAELSAWNAKHYLTGYGLVGGARLAVQRRRLNAGVFCALGDAPQWASWRTAMETAVSRTGRVTPHDQFAMNKIVFLDRVPVGVLEPRNNWVSSRGIPRWNTERSVFCTPNRALETISIVHLAGHRAKSGGTFEVTTTDGTVIHTGLRFNQRPQAPEIR
ncbi:hypothetical protein ABC795_01460 [Blastococcus sp. HT6-30]|uniref:hypothetical protein n=1 Tax=Blastococcus sp. HT6-30 TaxID=3144843 RepID=UPI00321BBA6C